FVIDSVLLLGSMTVSRSSFRLVGEFLSRQREAGTRAIVYGAGDGGALAVRELQRRPKPVRILGFIDDAPHKSGTPVIGYRVLGGLDLLVRMIVARDVELVVLGARNIDVERVRAVRAACAANGVALTRLTVGMEDLIVPFDSAAGRMNSVSRL